MQIFEKIFPGDKKNAFDEIIKTYKKKGFLTVNYLYFANLISNGIIGNKKLNQEFSDSLNIGDLLLPDGIALKLYVKKYFQKELENLNGTDFSEYLLENLDKNEINLILYGGKKEVIEKASKNIGKKYGLEVFYYQDGYSEFNFSKLDLLRNNFSFFGNEGRLSEFQSFKVPVSEIIEENKKNLINRKINIFMVGLGTPKQEIWVKNNIENIKKYNLLTLTQGGTFDFWAGNEKRAPKIFIDLKLEWLWRFITNPKKNFKKVLNSFWLFWFLLKK